jgi:hypothetical protein
MENAIITENILMEAGKITDSDLPLACNRS